MPSIDTILHNNITNWFTSKTKIYDSSCGIIKTLYFLYIIKDPINRTIIIKIDTTINLIDAMNIMSNCPSFNVRHYKCIFHKSKIVITLECLEKEFINLNSCNHNYKQLSIYATHIVLKNDILRLKINDPNIQPENSMPIGLKGVPRSHATTQVQKVLDHLHAQNINVKKCVYKINNIDKITNIDVQNMKFQFSKKFFLNISIEHRASIINNSIIKNLVIDNDFIKNIDLLNKNTNVEELTFKIGLIQFSQIESFLKLFQNVHKINIIHNVTSFDNFTSVDYNDCGTLLCDTLARFTNVKILDLYIVNYYYKCSPLIAQILNCTSLLQVNYNCHNMYNDDISINSFFDILCTTSLCVNITFDCCVNVCNFEKLLQLESSKTDKITFHSLRLKNLVIRQSEIRFVGNLKEDKINELCDKYPNHPLLRCVHGLSSNNRNNVCKYNKLLSEYF